LQLGQLIAATANGAPVLKKLRAIDVIAGEEIQRLRDMNADDPPMDDPSHLLSSTAAALARKWQISCSYAQCTDANAAMVLREYTGSHIANDLAFAMEEIVANGVRHGAATTINFLLSADDAGLKLQAHSNGSAPEASQLPPKSLSGRVANLGGTLNITADANGVSIEILFENREYANG
jgi:signal transduction histidine kinase